MLTNLSHQDSITSFCKRIDCSLRLGFFRAFSQSKLFVWSLIRANSWFYLSTEGETRNWVLTRPTDQADQTYVWTRPNWGMRTTEWSARNFIQTMISPGRFHTFRGKSSTRVGSTGQHYPRPKSVWSIPVFGRVLHPGFIVNALFLLKWIYACMKCNHMVKHESLAARGGVLKKEKFDKSTLNKKWPWLAGQFEVLKWNCLMVIVLSNFIS